MSATGRPALTASVGRGAVRGRAERPGDQTPDTALGYLSGPGERRAIAAACERLGLELVGVDRDRDTDAPGAGLTRALERIAAGDAGCLVVSRLDVLRGAQGLAPVLEHIEAEAIRLVAVDVGLDTDEAAGRLALTPRARARLPWLVTTGDDAAAGPSILEPLPAVAAPEDPSSTAVVDQPPGPPAALIPGPLEPFSPAPEPAPPAPRPEPTAEPGLPAPGPAPAAARPRSPDPAAQSPGGGATRVPPARATAAAAAETVAIGYASAPEAEGGAARELAEQRRAIATCCASLGLELAELVGDREPKDGKALDRPGISHALQRLAAGEASCLVVSGLERLSRSVAELGPLVRWLESNDVRLIAVDLELDTATPAGRAAAAALVSVAAWEHDRLSQRTREGLAAARAKRHAAGGARTPESAALRKRIAAMRADGMTLQAIADALNREGVPTERGGAKWRPSSVQSAAGYKRPARTRSVDRLNAPRPPREP